MSKAEKIKKIIVNTNKDTYFAKQSLFYEKFYTILNGYNDAIKLQEKRRSTTQTNK